MKKRIRTHTNPLNIRQRLTDVDISKRIKNYNNVHLEIGFGKGRFLSQYAKNHPDDLVVGVEVRKQAVVVFDANHDLPNCTPIWGAGQICLEDVIPNQSLQSVFIFHPDPWFKKRHHKRRVINTELIRLIKTKMAPGGVVYISTDVLELYDDIMQVLLTEDDKLYLANHPFWLTDYQTHWSQFSVLDQRSHFRATFKFKEES